MMSKRFSGLWQQPEFMKLWTAQTISRLGSQIGGGALRFTAILMLGATPWQLSLLSAAAMLPALLVGLFAGVWVDRLRRRPILIAADLGRALLLLSIPLAYVVGLLRIEQLYVVAALTGVLTIWFDVAYHAFLPSVVQREQLVDGNSKLSVSDSVAEITGPPVGGTLVQLLSAPFAIVLDALSFIMSAFALWSMRTVEARPTVTADRSRVREEIFVGLRAVVRQPVLRALFVSTILLSLAGGVIGGLYDVYLLRELGLSPALVGVTVGVGGIGALFGAFLSPALVERFGVGRAMVGGLIIFTVSAILLPLAQGPVLLAFIVILVAQASDIAGAVFFINELSVRQSITPEHLLGRVNASFSFVSTAAGLVGVLLGGALGETIGLRAGMAVGVFGVACGCLWLFWSPVRSLRDVRAMVTEEPELAVV